MGWRPLVAKYFPADQVDNALAVMHCESGGVSSRVGDTNLTYWSDGTLYGYSVGLMQVRRLPGRPEKDWLLDPENNIKWSAGLWRARGWQPSWSCATRLGIK